LYRVSVSHLENSVAQVLRDCGIRFIRQVPIRGRDGRYVGIADFYFPVIGFVLEVNGTYWHADPRVYSGRVLDSAQGRHRAAWDRKVARLRELRVPLAVVWEIDLRLDIAVAIAKSLREVSQ
jgi:G:T-mismatch repair DNA endonuclease (very short patch repair protein)